MPQSDADPSSRFAINHRLHHRGRMEDGVARLRAGGFLVASSSRRFSTNLKLAVSLAGVARKKRGTFPSTDCPSTAARCPSLRSVRTTPCCVQPPGGGHLPTPTLLALTGFQLVLSTTCLTVSFAPTEDPVCTEDGYVFEVRSQAPSSAITNSSQCIVPVEQNSVRSL